MTRPLRLIIQQAERCWVVSFPDEPEIEAITEGAIPLPFTEKMPREDVVQAMSLKFPQHQLQLVTTNSPVHNSALSLFSIPFHISQLSQPWSMSISDTEADPAMVFPSWQVAIQVSNYATGPHGGMRDVYLHPTPDLAVTCLSLGDWISLI